MTEPWIQTLTIIGAVVVATISGVIALWKILGRLVDDAREVSKTANEGISQRIDSVDKRIDDMGSNVQIITSHLLNRPMVQNEVLWEPQRGAK